VPFLFLCFIMANIIPVGQYALVKSSAAYIMQKIKLVENILSYCCLCCQNNSTMTPIIQSFIYLTVQT